LEERIERRPDRAGGTSSVIRVANLSDDLRLADHHGVDRRSDTEKMLDDVALGFFIQMRAELLRRNAAQTRKEVQHLFLLRAAVDGAGGVKLDAVAGAEKHRLAAVELLAQRGHGGDALIRRESETLAQLERRGGVI